MTPARLAALSLAATAALLAGGCRADSSPLLSRQSSTPAAAKVSPGLGGGGGKATIPAPGPTGTPANAMAVKVIEGWSSALRRGDVRTAATYFQVPSEMINGIGANGALALIRIRSLAQAQAANETLPCGAKFISADQRGRYVNALFKLTGRLGVGGSSCGSGPGATARTNFVIANGRIVEWIRAPDDPGDNGSPPSPQGSGGTTPLV